MDLEIRPLLRILRPMAAFKAAASADIQSYLAGLPTPQGQTLLGIYENTAGLSADAVIVTDQSLCISKDAALEEIKYADIDSATWTPEEKLEANALRLTLRDGTIKLVPIRGRQGRGADVFEFLRFVMRAVHRTKTSAQIPPRER